MSEHPSEPKDLEPSVPQAGWGLGPPDPFPQTFLGGWRANCGGGRGQEEEAGDGWSVRYGTVRSGERPVAGLIAHAAVGRSDVGGPEEPCE